MFCKYLLLVFLTVTVTGFDFPIDFTADDEVISAISDGIASKFSHEYIKFLKTGQESIALRQLSNQLAKSHSQRDIFTTGISELESLDQFFICTTCRSVINVLIEMFRTEDGELSGPNSEANSKKIALELCNRFNMQIPEVCSGLVDLNWPILHYIIMNTEADSRSFCGTIPISFCETKQINFEWNITIDGSKEPLSKPKSDIPQKTDNDLTVVQITDIHFDPDYKPGNLADCEHPLCCRQAPDSRISDEAKAGYWSDYRNCDSPLHMIENAFDHVKKTYKKIDYIYQTGDIVPHNVWSTTKEGNKAMLTQINNLIAEKFDGTPVYPCVGNHEPHPANVFGHNNVPENMKVNWLYKHLWSNWQRWLPIEAKETVLKGGYYTVSPRPGFRIISLNNNDCYVYNWWIYFDGNVTSQPQLDWLQETLLAAESAGEHVHILAHLPSGDADCWTVWAREYNRIIERYSHIIGGIFGGHTHKDEMNLHYSQNGHAMAIYWNGGSLTSYSYKNPNYRTYEVEPTTYQVVDHHTWIFNLTEANEYGDQRTPQWIKEYQFTEFTNDLSPAGINAWIKKMTEAPAILRQYWKYKMTSADPKLAAGCNESCLQSTICSLVRTVYNNKSRCNELKARLRESLSKEVTDVAPTEKPNEGDGNNSAATMTASITFIVALFRILF